MHKVASRGYASGGSTGGNGSWFGMGGGGNAGGVHISGISASAAEQISAAAQSHPIYLMAEGKTIARLVSSGNAAYTRSS